MDFEVQLSLGNDNWYSTHLTVRQKFKEIYFDYGPSDASPIMTDRFFSFQQIQIGSLTDPLIIKFYGSIKRTIRFLSGKDLSNIWLYLQRFITMPNIETPNEMFSFMPKNNGVEEPKKEHVMSPSYAKKLKEFEKNDPVPVIPKISMKIDFANPASIQFLDKIPSLVTPLQLKSILVDKKLSSTYLLSTLDFSKAAMAQVYSMALIPDNFDEEKIKYIKITKQWKNMSKEQWKNNSLFRKFVLSLELNLDSCDIKSDTLKMLIYESLISCMFF